MNARGGDGAEVIYALRNNDTLPNLILNELENEGQNIRKSYQRRLPSNPTKDYYFMQRNTGNTETITVEYGFLDSKSDDITQLKNNWEKYAEAVVRAIMKYLNLNYIPKNNTFYYTVKAGDTLWSIAKKYGLTVTNLKNINNLSSSTLKIGQTLIIPSINDVISETNYIVKKGDTLYKIAKNYNTTIDEILNLNNLMNDTLSIGQVLKIPAENNIYLVQKGDTLYKIAQQNNTTVENLIKLNNLKNTILSINQELKLK